MEPAPVLSPVHLHLAQWLSRYYLCSLFSAVGLMLPPGFEARVRSRISRIANPEIGTLDAPQLRPQTIDALVELEQKSGMDETECVKLLGRSGSQELTRLIDIGVVNRQVTMPRPRVLPKYHCFLLPAGSPDAARDCLLYTSYAADE